MNKKHNKKALQDLKRIRGIERERHFKSGGSHHEWRGGLHTITQNRKKKASRTACRGKIKL